MPEKKVTSIKIDPEIWSKSRIYCLQKGITISDLVETLLKKEVKDSK